MLAITFIKVSLISQQVASFVKKLKLLPNQLAAKQLVKDLGFKSTDELKNHTGILGQERACSAIQFGVAMHRAGYNIYVMGEPGTGKMSYIRKYLETGANRQTPPDDWAYINNFDDPRKPGVLRLPAGLCTKLQKDLEEFINKLLMTFPAAFENPTYQQRKNIIERNFNTRYDHAVDQIEQEGIKRKIAMYRETGSLSFTPMADGKPMDETEFAQLPDKKREKFNNHITELETRLNKSLVELPQWKRESNEKLQKLNQETIDQALEPLLKPMEKTYSHEKCIIDYLEAVKHHLHRIVIELLTDDRAMESREDASKRATLVELYALNVVVSHPKKPTTPVIYESHPNYKNLFGRIEYTSEMGALTTNHRHICPGSLHQANGGYLLLEAHKLLEEPFVWEAFKRAMTEQQLKIESPYAEMGLLNTTTLTPTIIPLDVKIILMGSRNIYYVLQQLDSDFHKMFRVLVDFDDQIQRCPKMAKSFAQLLKNRADDEGYPPLTASAVARMIEHSSRLTENQNQMSAKIGDLFDLLAEADFIRRINKDKNINHLHIDRALNAKAERTGRVSTQILQEVLEGSILIDTAGEKVGKINGLTVLAVGDTSFGSPARITATVYPGSHGIVDIEREVSLGQAAHSKGVMILTGYIGSKYAQHFPLAISANLAMEQSYGYIDGDSASMAELCCLLSALTGTPIKQCFAITGSMNQHGEVQAIGGVNEKIEGFFDICKARGLTGEQGVIIPEANIRNLMLHQKVIDAVKIKKFNIYAVSHVEEALELLTGNKPGALNTQGQYTKNTINYKVVQRLKEIAELSKDNNQS
ncbi:MAG: ATP-binding protein [Candidatus Endonucleobacter sp. (ex Gigantidas childressi)]|nr:ATP-binding protein [Candidatus Endonucleobacter sp. (ex Gigantidas childressi)]